MIKRIFFLVAVFFCMTIAKAQQIELKGRVVEDPSRLAVEYATAALLSTDSVLVTGATTDAQGEFGLRVHKTGDYILRVTFMGFKTRFLNVHLADSCANVDLGDVEISANEQILNEAVVKRTLARVEQKEDTTIFNAGAYRVPTGSSLEALVKQLPGVEIDENGKITMNGKEVKELLLNGKDFFKGNKKMAMKNLPTEMVHRIRAYDKQSDFSQFTGIDDGEERTVLDIVTKRQMNESLISNVDVGYGTEERYTGKAFVSRFTDHARVTGYGSINNVNDKGFGSNKGWGGNSGLIAHKDAGVDFAWENGKDKRQGGFFEISGNVNYSYVGTDKLSTSASETFLSSGKGSSFRNSSNQNSSSSQNVDASLRLEWFPDSLTSITFMPNYRYSSSKNDGFGLTATFNEDPFSIENMFAPLDSLFSDYPSEALKDILVNQNRSQSLGDSKNNQVGGELNVIRRLNQQGRNVSLKVTGNYSESENHMFNISHIAYANGQNPTFLNQYSSTPSKNWNYKVQLGYVEPITKKWFGELRYTYGYKYSDSDKSRYNLEKILDDPKYVWNDPENIPLIGTLPSSDELLNAARDLYNSQYATYDYIDHTANIGVRYQSEPVRFSAGVDLNPEHTKMAYERLGQAIDTVISRDVFNVSPQMRLRFRISNTQNLDLKYRGSSSQPSMTDLLSVVDNSNPLNISMGNPGLKPSWNNSFRIFYRGYKPEKQQGMGGGLMFNQIKNAVSNLMVYDEATGVRYTRPQNISGNWDTRAMYMFSTGVGPEKNFTISSFSNLGYSHNVGYVSSFDSNENGSLLSVLLRTPSQLDLYDQIFDNANIEKSLTRNFSFRESLRLGYRNDWFDVGASGKLNYNHARSDLQDNNNMDTWNFSYGLNANLNFDWGMSLSTDLGMNSRRGFSDASMNSDELLWNAQITQSFLKNKAATISLQFYDILQEQSNVSRTVNAMMRNDTWTNAINSYCMIHFIYKLNIFGGNGGKKAAEENERSKYERYRPGKGGGYGGPRRKGIY